MYYTLIDLFSGRTVQFENKTDLLQCLERRFPQSLTDFRILNVTGNDIITYPKEVAYTYGDGFCSVEVYRRTSHLRQYQVRDEYGRSIDIRLWADEIEKVLNDLEKMSQRPYKPDHSAPQSPDYRKGPCGCGKKRVCRREGLGTLYHHSIKESCDPGISDDDYAGFTPVVDHSESRKRGFSSGDSWGRYERRFFGKLNSSKCWKDQSKAGRQWAKHRRGCSKVDLRRGFAEKYPDQETLDVLEDTQPLSDSGSLESAA